MQESYGSESLHLDDDPAGGGNMDEHGYPEESEIDHIINWTPAKGETWRSLFEYIQERWQYAECGYWEEPSEGNYHISTGGWSGNEEIIGAMMCNRVFWMMCWLESRRGGHYKFRLPGK